MTTKTHTKTFHIPSHELTCVIFFNLTDNFDTTNLIECILSKTFIFRNNWSHLPDHNYNILNFMN